MILITHHKHQYLFICMWSKLRMFDFLENEIYILSVTEGVSWEEDKWRKEEPNNTTKT